MVTALLFCLYLLAAILTLLLLAEWTDRRLDERFPSYARGWARVFGETPEPPTHVRRLPDGPVLRSHRPCRACHQEGTHDEGCSYLDRLDAGEARP